MQEGFFVSKTRRPDVPQPLLTTRQAADALGVSPAFLARDRWLGARIPFVRVGPRSVRYRAADLEDFIRANSSAHRLPEKVNLTREHSPRRRQG